MSDSKLGVSALQPGSNNNDATDPVETSLALYAALRMACNFCARLYTITAEPNDVMRLEALLTDEELRIRNDLLERMSVKLVQLKCLSEKLVYSDNTCPLASFRMEFSKNFSAIFQLTFRCIAEAGYNNNNLSAQKSQESSTIKNNCAETNPQKSATSGLGSSIEKKASDTKNKIVLARRRRNNTNNLDAATTNDDEDPAVADDADAAATKLRAVKSMPSARSLETQLSQQQQQPPSRFREEFITERIIGKGGFGKVWKVRNNVDGQFYAIKCITITHGRNYWRVGTDTNKAGGGGGGNMRFNPVQRILREVKVLSGLHNEHVVGYHAAWLEQADNTTAVADNSSSAAHHRDDDESDQQHAHHHISSPGNTEQYASSSVSPGLQVVPHHHQQQAVLPKPKTISVQSIEEVIDKTCMQAAVIPFQPEAATISMQPPEKEAAAAVLVQQQARKSSSGSGSRGGGGGAHSSSTKNDELIRDPGSLQTTSSSFTNGEFDEDKEEEEDASDDDDNDDDAEKHAGGSGYDDDDEDEAVDVLAGIDAAAAVTQQSRSKRTDRKLIAGVSIVPKSKSRSSEPTSDSIVFTKTSLTGSNNNPTNPVSVAGEITNDNNTEKRKASIVAAADQLSERQQQQQPSSPQSPKTVLFSAQQKLRNDADDVADAAFAKSTKKLNELDTDDVRACRNPPPPHKISTTAALARGGGGSGEKSSLSPARGGMPTSPLTSSFTSQLTLCIQMELCDASLSQYLWARNFYMQCESELQISRVLQQGLRDPFIPASVFQAVINHSYAATTSKVDESSSSPAVASKLPPRQNSGIGLNLMHCIDVASCLRIVRQILLGIEYIHSRGLVHRDLKPSNIFFKFDPAGASELCAKIGDFGLARYITSAAAAAEEQQLMPPQQPPLRSTTVRRLSVGVGTMAYASPEQLSGRSYDSKSDIFSFGLIMFEIIVPFFTHMERNKLLNELRAARVPPAFRQQYPRLEVLLRSLLNADPSQRPTAQKILQSDVFENKDYIISNLREKLISAEEHIEMLEKRLLLQSPSSAAGSTSSRSSAHSNSKRKMSDTPLCYANTSNNNNNNNNNSSVGNNIKKQ